MFSHASTIKCLETNAEKPIRANWTFRQSHSKWKLFVVAIACLWCKQLASKHILGSRHKIIHAPPDVSFTIWTRLVFFYNLSTVSSLSQANSTCFFFRRFEISKDPHSNERVKISPNKETPNGLKTSSLHFTYAYKRACCASE